MATSASLSSAPAASPPPTLPPAFSLHHCAWLGWDLDHTLARYNLSTFSPLVYGLVVRHLVEQQGLRCADLLSVPFQAECACRGVAFDTRTGHLIQLASDGRVTAAMHGLRHLTAADIAEAYSEPLQAIDEDKRFLVVQTHFESCCTFLLSRVVDRADDGSLFPPTTKPPATTDSSAPPQSPYERLVSSLLSAFEYEFGDWQRGTYFASLRADVGRYIYSRPAVRQWLSDMRARQQQGLFLVTNSRMDYTALLCNHILGEDWQRLFDFVVVDATKPAFFSSQPHAAPFHPLDPHTLAADTTRPLPADCVLPRGLYVHGTAQQLTRAMRAARSDPRPILYFEDNLQSGVAAIRQHCTDWLVGAVVEELADERVDESSHSQAGAAQQFASEANSPFGAALWTHTRESSYWAHRMRRTAHMSLACFSEVAHWHAHEATAAAAGTEQWVTDDAGHLSLVRRTPPPPNMEAIR